MCVYGLAYTKFLIHEAYALRSSSVQVKSRIILNSVFLFVLYIHFNDSLIYKLRHIVGG